VIVPYTRQGWSNHSLDGPASLIANGYRGEFCVMGLELPPKLTSYLGCTPIEAEPNPFNLVAAACQQDCVAAIMDLSCFATSDISPILSKACGKLVCGTGPDPMPTLRARLADHGMPDELFPLDQTKIQAVLRAILASQGRRYSSGFVAGDRGVWEGLFAFMRVCGEAGICVLNELAWEAVINLYAHCVGGVEVLPRGDYAQVDAAWGKDTHAVIGQRREGGIRFRDMDPAAFAAEASRFEGKPSKRSLMGRPMMKVSRVAQRAEYR